MAETLHEYEVMIAGIPHTLMLSAQDAERYGDGATRKKATVSTKSSSPSNKAATPEDK